MDGGWESVICCLSELLGLMMSDDAKAWRGNCMHQGGPDVWTLDRPLSIALRQNPFDGLWVG